ncbi:MAG: hypothetical protein ACRDSH_19250, partial [Pseudonocardiaceae bacterium]
RTAVPAPHFAHPSPAPPTMTLHARVSGWAAGGNVETGDQVAGQSDTTVCWTLIASPLTRALTGRLPGTTSDERRRRVAEHDPGAQNPPRKISSRHPVVSRPMTGDDH